jgi:hypothetical protein
MVRDVSSSENFFIGEYLNDYFGTIRWGFERIHKTFGYNDQN